MGVTAIHAPRAGRVRSLPELLQRRTDAQPDDRAYTFLDDGEREGARVTWGDLERRARTLASAVADRTPPLSRVLILCPPGLDFVPAFFGVLAGGAIAVPCYPPRAPRHSERAPASPDSRSIERLRGIVRDCRPALVLAPASLVDRRSMLVTLVPELRDVEWLAVDGGVEPTARPLPSVEPGAMAFLQYTSGSTAEPRGVMVTHSNLLHNLADAHRLARHGAGSASVSWLPVIHDMGLIQGILQGLFSGFPSWLMSPAAFLQRPARWLQAISWTRATISGAPDFAYELCARRIGLNERAALDLRSWRLAFNGAEPIRQETLDAFAEAFAGSGFDRRAFRPSYGLAEATLLVATGRGATTCCGAPAPSTQIRIVDPVTRCESPRGSSGEIWIAGPGVAAGYWEQPAASQATFGARIAVTGEGPFLRSGDLGSLQPDGLHVNGRIKDVLIVRGLKHFPQDIEQTIGRAVPALRAGGCAVFALPAADGERVAVAAELDRDALAVDAEHAIVASIRECVAGAHGIQISAVALISAGTIPKTTSGKLQRYACREGLLDGRLPCLTLWTDADFDLAKAS